jgi:cell division protein FtsB
LRFERISGPRKGLVSRTGGRTAPPPRPARRTDEPAAAGPAARPEHPHVHPLSYVGFSPVVSVLLFVFFLAGDRGFLQVRKQRSQVGALQAEVSAIAERNVALEKEVSRLTKDPAAVEKIAREDLSLVAPGDVVLVLPPGFEEKVTPRRTPAASPAASGR